MTGTGTVRARRKGGQRGADRLPCGCTQHVRHLYDGEIVLRVRPRGRKRDTRPSMFCDEAATARVWSAEAEAKALGEADIRLGPDFFGRLEE